jgi:beta-galactosidase
MTGWHFLVIILCCAFFSGTAARTVQSLNCGWKFYLTSAADSSLLTPAGSAYNDASWQTVCVPHTFQYTDYHFSSIFRGIGWYRRIFTVDSSAQGKKVFLEFQGAMTVARIFVNGVPLKTHQGGFLPFTVDVTGSIINGTNVVSVRIDNSYQTLIPPEKWDNSWVDFCLFGGLYRNVNLIVTDKLYVPDPLSGTAAPGAGIFVTTPSVSSSNATVQVKTTVKNEYATVKSCTLKTTIVDKNGNSVTTGQTAGAVAPGATYTFTQNIIVNTPLLWSSTNPVLYNAKTEVYDDTALADTLTTRFGIRSIRFTRDSGFYLNGNRVKLLGLNRHQTFPYIGHALPDNAQKRDAKVLKDAGCNFIRLSHYPQSPAFLDACDSLGIMAWEEVPTWMPFSPFNTTWEQNHYQNIRDMIRRDRNHPSIVVWGVGVNEGSQDMTFENICQVDSKSEDSTGYTTAARNYETSTNPFDIYGHNCFVPPLPGAIPDPASVGYINSEHTGHTYPTHRWASEDSLIEHCRRHEAMTAEAYSRSWAAGTTAWCAFDYYTLRNSENGVIYHGVADLFRIPKFAYYFYQAQSAGDGYNGSLNPMVFIESVNNYSVPSTPTIKIQSNCEEVELFVNGISVGTIALNQGNLTSRWCACDANLNHWWKVDLGSNYDIRGTEVMWESVTGNLYKYKVEVSSDNAFWTLAVDKTANTNTAQIQNDPFNFNARYVRITVTGMDAGSWASFYNFKVVDSSGKNIALNKPAGADCEQSANPAFNGNDSAMTLAHPPFIFSSVNYTLPGTLHAEGRIGGVVRAVQTLLRPGTPAVISLKSDTDTLLPDGTDIARVVVSILDENGTLIRSAANTVTVSVSGPGKVICGSAGPQTSGSITVEGGQLAFLVQSGLSPGILTATATGGGLADGQVTITVLGTTGIIPRRDIALPKMFVGPVIRCVRQTAVFDRLDKNMPAQIMVVKMSGRVVRSIRVSGKTAVSLKLTECPAGVYVAIVKYPLRSFQKNILLLK